MQSPSASRSSRKYLFCAFYSGRGLDISEQWAFASTLALQSVVAADYSCRSVHGAARSLRVKRTFTLAITALAFALCLAGTSDQPLLDAGLTKVENYYELETDQHLSDRLREISAATQQNLTIVHQQQALAADSAAQMADINQLQSQIADLNDRLARTSVSARSARKFLEDQVKGLAAQIKIDQQKIDKDNTHSAALRPADIANLNVKLADDMDAAETKYDLLAKDHSVQQALQASNGNDAKNMLRAISAVSGGVAKTPSAARECPSRHCIASQLVSQRIRSYHCTCGDGRTHTSHLCNDREPRQRFDFAQRPDLAS